MKQVFQQRPVSIHESVTSYFQTSSKDILLSVSLSNFSCPPCLEYLCPRALILLRLWRYINHVLTYLLIHAQHRIMSCTRYITHCVKQNTAKHILYPLQHVENHYST